LNLIDAKNASEAVFMIFLVIELQKRPKIFQ